MRLPRFLRFRKRKRVLVACEFSGRVREAFRAKGFDAWSCDILPADDGSKFHIQDDVLKHLDEGWDLIIAHPPCTHLASSGAQYWTAKRADGRQQAAMEFFMAMYNAPAPLVAVENPVGYVSRAFRKPDQIFQPWQFGDPYNKKTCLWLKGLPPLESTNIVEPIANWSDGSYRSGSRKRSALPSLHRNEKKRSETFPGFASAMAEQWGKLL